MEFLKQPSSVHAYAEVEAKLAEKDDTPSDKAKGFLQRKFKKFVDDYDEHHDWADLSRVVLSEGVSVWCCGRCCTVIEQNPSASFKELRQKTGCPLVQSEGDGGSSVDEERQQALEDARQENEELKAALAASKRAASEQPGATMPPALPDLSDRSASVTKTEGKVGQPVSVGDLHEQTQQMQQQTQQQTQHLEEQMQQHTQQQTQQMQQQTQQQTQHLEEQMQQQMQQMQQQMQQMQQQTHLQMMHQMQQQTEELTGILRTNSSSDGGSDRRPSVASNWSPRASQSSNAPSLRPKEQVRAPSKGSKSGPYFGLFGSNKK